MKSTHTLKAAGMGIVACLALLGFIARAPRGERIARQLLAQSLTTSRLDSPIAEALKLLTATTQFNERWQINKPVDPSKVNVYVIDSSSWYNPPSFADSLADNCAFVGLPNVVICDAKLLETFLRQIGVTASYEGHPQEQEFMAVKQQTFLKWILGHELGHIVHMHLPAHFQRSDFSEMVATSTLDHQLEFEADEFVCQTLSPNEDERVNLESTLMDIINAEIVRKVGPDLPAGVGIIYDYNGTRVVEYLRQGSHPEFVVRATRMLLCSAELSGDEGFKNFIEGFASHMREATK